MDKNVKTVKGCWDTNSKLLKISGIKIEICKGKWDNKTLMYLKDHTLSWHVQ